MEMKPGRIQLRAPLELKLRFVLQVDLRKGQFLRSETVPIITARRPQTLFDNKGHARAESFDHLYFDSSSLQLLGWPLGME